MKRLELYEERLDGFAVMFPGSTQTRAQARNIADDVYIEARAFCA